MIVPQDLDETGLAERIARLPVFSGSVDISPLSGGITNRNYLVTSSGRRAVVRLGADIPVHHILRSNELAASRAAHAAGISPAVLHAEPGILVLDYVEARPLSPADVRDRARLPAIVDLVARCHRVMPAHFRGPAMIFWVFHVVRDYAANLKAAGSVHADAVDRLVAIGDALEQAAGPFDMVFGHNDLLPANLLDDGKRLWLIDWDYAGFNTPLFDLGGLASNNEMDEDGEREMLRLYTGSPADGALWRRYQAMKCASLLRETMWSMISEIHSTLDFDYSAYTADNMARFERAHETFLSLKD